MKQLVVGTITDKRSLPYNNAGTGTIVTFGNAIVGTGTLFNTEMKAGSFLVSLDGNECVKVYRVDSDTKAFLEKPFASDLTSQAPEIIEWYRATPKLISIYTSDAIFVDGESFTGGLAEDKTGNSKTSRRDLIDPIVVDANGGSITVEILY